MEADNPAILMVKASLLPPLAKTWAKTKKIFVNFSTEIIDLFIVKSTFNSLRSFIMPITENPIKATTPVNKLSDPVKFKCPSR